MKNVVIASLVVAVAAMSTAFAIDGLPHGKHKPTYWVELDNAFGLINGGDLKIAGARAGKITQLDLDRRNLHARVGFQVTQAGFGDLRVDATCESRPQSLIGEYFLDCQSGHSPRKLRDGGVIPVSHTSSTIAPDLVNDITRLPERQRLSIILSELGAGVAGNASSLNTAIRRAVPALRETDRVLGILARQNHVIADLNLHADTVVKALADDRRQVSRWVVKSRDLSRDSATRARDIAEGFRLLPGFLEQLRPTMSALGDASQAQTPALRNLDTSARQLRRFFDDLGPFSQASRPAVRALGKASVTGRQAVQAATPTVRQLQAFAGGAPELGRNLAIILEHLDNRSYAAETDARAARQQGVAGPSGYSGLEALLQYVEDITTSTNIYDQNFHLLNVTAFQGGDCSNYTDAQTRKSNPALDRCVVQLGPNAPAINFPDSSSGIAPETGPTAAVRARSAKTRAARTRAAPTRAASAASASAASVSPQAAGPVLDYLLGP